MTVKSNYTFAGLAAQHELPVLQAFFSVVAAGAFLALAVSVAGAAVADALAVHEAPFAEAVSVVAAEALSEWEAQHADLVSAFFSVVALAC
jgi:hypothetical protein